MWRNIGYGFPHKIEKWPLSCSNLLPYRETRLAFDSHYTSLSLDPHKMPLNIDMKIILTVKFSGVSFNLNNKSLTTWLICNVVNPGKNSTRIHWLAVISNSVQVSVFLRCFWTTPAPFDWELSCILPRHNTWSEKDVDFCALKADDLFITNLRQILPWRIFPINCFHSIDLILFGHHFRRYVEHLFHWRHLYS